MRAPLPPGLMSRPIAHRALHDRAAGRVENSPAAIQAAIDHGYAIEIDLQLSSDGVAMVFHDDELNRLTAATGPVSARSATHLRALRLTDSTDTIPTLAEVLALVDGRVPLLIEIKDQSLVMGPTDGRLEAATAEALKDYKGEVALMSFNPACIHHLLALAPQIPRGIVTAAYDPESWAPMPPDLCAHFRAIPDYDPTLSSFISHEAADLASPRVAELKSQGAAVLCWTIRSPEAEAQARRVAQNVTFEGYLSPTQA
jgi:glycerophosphoryl diester phosphodiesterase